MIGLHAVAKARNAHAHALERLVSRTAAGTETSGAAAIVRAMRLVREHVIGAQLDTQSRLAAIGIARKDRRLAAKRKRTLQKIARRRAQLAKALFGSVTAQSFCANSTAAATAAIRVGERVFEAERKALLFGTARRRRRKERRHFANTAVALRLVRIGGAEKLLREARRHRIDLGIARIGLAKVVYAAAAQTRSARRVGEQTGALEARQFGARGGTAERRHSPRALCVCNNARTWQRRGRSDSARNTRHFQRTFFVRKRLSAHKRQRKKIQIQPFSAHGQQTAILSPQQFGLYFFRAPLSRQSKHADCNTMVVAFIAGQYALQNKKKVSGLVSILIALLALLIGGIVVGIGAQNGNRNMLIGGGVTLAIGAIALVVGSLLVRSANSASKEIAQQSGEQQSLLPPPLAQAGTSFESQPAASQTESPYQPLPSSAFLDAESQPLERTGASRNQQAASQAPSNEMTQADIMRLAQQAVQSPQARQAIRAQLASRPQAQRKFDAALKKLDVAMLFANQNPEALQGAMSAVGNAARAFKSRKAAA